MFEQLNFRVNFNGADFSNLIFSSSDRMVLRELAKRVAELSQKPEMDKKRKLWKKHNALERTRPVVLCDPENGWNEIITTQDIKCVNSVARYWEDHLRKQIFWGEKMGDDYVVEPIFNVPYIYKDIPWAIRGLDRVSTSKKTAEDGKAYHIDAILDDFSMLDRIIAPTLELDYDTTWRSLALAHTIFDGILAVQLNTVWFWSFGLTDDYVFLRGIEKLLFDFIDEPDNLHALMKILLNGTMDRLDFLESEGLLCLNNNSAFTGSGGMGYIDGVMPAPDFTGSVRTKDMWGLAESQVTIGVSPDMFEEFIFPYQKQLMERFALTCYGCCEPMDDRMDIVKRVGNLRRVSVSAWADRRIMSEKLKHDYIYSLKPNPAMISSAVIDKDLIRKYIKESLALTKDNCLEVVMKDNHTLGNNPENIITWTKMLKAEIGC